MLLGPGGESEPESRVDRSSVWEVMAVFNAPNKLPDHASAGLQCGVAIQRAVRKHKVLVNGDEKPIRVRVGVHTASILAGNIGSHQRIKYGLLGDGVNLAARMKGGSENMRLFVYRIWLYMY